MVKPTHLINHLLYADVLGLRPFRASGRDVCVDGGLVILINGAKTPEKEEGVLTVSCVSPAPVL